MNRDAMWPGQIRRDPTGKFWICTDARKDDARWVRVTGNDKGSSVCGDRYAQQWDIVNESSWLPLPPGQARVSPASVVWQKIGTVWANALDNRKVADDSVRDFRVIWTPEEDQ